MKRKPAKTLSPYWDVVDWNIYYQKRKISILCDKQKIPELRSHKCCCLIRTTELSLTIVFRNQREDTLHGINHFKLGRLIWACQHQFTVPIVGEYGWRSGYTLASHLSYSPSHVVEFVVGSRPAPGSPVFLLSKKKQFQIVQFCAQIPGL